MRWKTNDKTCPNEGDERIKKHFLFLPKTIKKETRWLEFSTYKQKYIFSGYVIDFGVAMPSYMWIETEWID